MNCILQARSTQLDLRHYLFAALAIMLILGCSDGAGGRQKVTGSISWGGEPLEGGWIYFRPIGAGSSSAGEITNGTFKIAAPKGLSAGSYKVAIEYHKPTGRKVTVYTGEEVEEKKQIIPRRYNAQTTLTIEIQSKGPNHLKFELFP